MAECAVEWHDVAETPPRAVLWAYLSSGLVEMATYGAEGGWRSAFNRDVEYLPDAILAWAMVEYPAAPQRQWVASEVDHG